MLRTMFNRVAKYVRVGLRPVRWREYEAYLRQALDAGYQVVPLETWLAGPDGFSGKILVLRHDVDAYPQAAWPMSLIERRLGLTSTFYFRWCSLRPGLIRRIRENGSQVGFHYETLTRYAIEHHFHTPEMITPEVMAACRATLKEEIACFKGIVGGCASVAAHGDQRAHAVGRTNDDLLQGQSWADFGISYTADDPDALRKIDCWVSDGEGAPTYWSSGVSFPEALAAGHRLVLFNTHPHHWGLGAAVVAERLVAYLPQMTWSLNTLERGRPEALAWYRYRDLSGRTP